MTLMTDLESEFKVVKRKRRPKGIIKAEISSNSIWNGQGLVPIKDVIK